MGKTNQHTEDMDPLERDFGDGLEEDNDMGEEEIEEMLQARDLVAALAPPPAFNPMPSPVARGPRFSTPASGAPPLWVAAAEQGAMGALVVQRLINGQPNDVGRLGLRATIEDLLSMWPTEGTYWLTPTALDGRKMGETVEKVIAFDHEALVRIRQARARIEQSGVPVAVAASSTSPEVLAFLVKIQTDADARAERERIEAKARDERREDEYRRKESELTTERSRLAEEKLHLSVLNTSNATDLQGKLMERDNERQAAASNQFLAMIQASRDAEDRRHQLQLEAERQRATEERARWGRERQEAKDDALARKEEEEKREARRVEELGRERERDREHMRLLMSVTQAKTDAGDPLKLIETMIERGAPLLEWAKAQGLIGQREDTKKDWPELIAATITAALQAKATHDQVKMIEMGAGVPDDDEEEEDEGPQRIRVQSQAVPQSHAPPILSVVQGPTGPTQSVSLAEMAGHSGQTHTPVPAPRTLSERIADLPEIGAMDPSVAKAARKAIREMVHKLRMTDKEQWADTITAAVTTAPHIINYCAAVSVHWALVEGQAEEGFAAQITEAVFASPLIPQEFPRKRDL